MLNVEDKLWQQKRLVDQNRLLQKQELQRMAREDMVVEERLRKNVLNNV